MHDSSNNNNETDQLRKERRITLALAILFFGSLISFQCCRVIKKQRDINREINKMKSRMEEFDEKIATELPKICQNIDSPVSGTYTAEGQAGIEEFTKSGGAIFCEVAAHCSVIFHTDASFDNAEDREKYDALVDLHEKAGPAYDYFLKEYYPEFIEYTSTDDELELFIRYVTEKYEVYIQTPAHMYQYSIYYNDMFFVDGESYYLMDEESQWYKKPRESQADKSDNSGSYSGTGKHGSSGYSYSDADDYAEDNMEEYLEDGLDYDEAYDEAYDDWDD